MIDTNYSTVPRHKFAELFTTGTITNDRKIGENYKFVGPEDLKSLDFTRAGKNRYIRHKVTGFVSQDSGSDGPANLATSFWASPTALLVRMACERTLAIKYDSIFFRAIVFSDEVHLYAKNNQILNSGPPIAIIPIADWELIYRD